MSPPAPFERVLSQGPFVVALRSGRAPHLVRVPTHANGVFELTWVEDGCVEFEVGRTIAAAHAGTAVVLPADVANTPRLRAASFCQVFLPRSALAEAADALGGAARPPVDPAQLGAGHPAAALLALIARHATGDDDPGVEAMIDALTFALVRPDAPRSTERRVDPRIRRALDRMRAGHGERLSIDQLAGEAGMSRSAFVRTFRAQVGDSPHRTLIELRLERAAAALRDGDDAILAVAEACGFGDPGRFARYFRARFGVSPRAYRRRVGR